MADSLKHILQRLDAFVFQHMQPLTNDGTTAIMGFITFFASHYFLLPANILLGLYFLILRKDKWSCFRLIIVSITSFILLNLLKLYFHRVRPVHPVHSSASGYSFPSGHAMSSVTFYGILIYFICTQIKNPFIKVATVLLMTLMVLAIGLSRIYLRVHYASDVVAGYFFGLVWLLISLFIIDKIQKRSNENVL